MSSKSEYSVRRLCLAMCATAFVLVLNGCASVEPVPIRKVQPRTENTTPEAALQYYQGLAKMTPGELGRERSILVAVQQTPFTQIRMAMLLGHPRVQQDLGKALSLLDAILKSSDLAAIPFQPLAREIADNYLERIKLENQLEKQGQQLNMQLKESQRKVAELQEKLDSLANIENSMIPRSRVVRPDGGKR